MATWIAMIFQHDRTLLIMLKLWCNISMTLPNRWIGHGSTFNWPPRSPDLTALDYCLWGWNNSEVYRTKVDTRDELLHLIMDVIASIKERQDALRRATSHVLTQVAKCIDIDSGILKNVLYSVNCTKFVT